MIFFFSLFFVVFFKNFSLKKILGIRLLLLESDNHECPSCHEQNVSPDNLIPNRFLRLSVDKFRKETGFNASRMVKADQTNDNGGKMDDNGNVQRDAQEDGENRIKNENSDQECSNDTEKDVDNNDDANNVKIEKIDNDNDDDGKTTTSITNDDDDDNQNNNDINDNNDESIMVKNDEKKEIIDDDDDDNEKLLADNNDGDHRNGDQKDDESEKITDNNDVVVERKRYVVEKNFLKVLKLKFNFCSLFKFPL